MDDLNNKTDGDQLSAIEWNQVATEIQNVIVASGQTLSGANLAQLLASLLIVNSLDSDSVTFPANAILGATPPIDDNSLEVATTEYVDRLNVFNGALVYSAANFFTANNVWDPVPWDSEEYDTDNIHDVSVSNDLLVVPAGATKVRLTAQVEWAITAATNDVGARIEKNALGISYAGHAKFYLDSVVSGEIPSTSISTAVLEVIAGDTFFLSVFQNSGGFGSTVGGVAGSSFSMEIIQ